MQRIGDWKRFIVFEDNKASLTHFLSTEMSQSYNAHPRPELVVNGGFRLNDILKVWSSYMSREDFEGLASNHEEAITRIVPHARDATVRGYSQVSILYRDTDVIVLLLTHREDHISMFSGTS